MHLKVIQKGEGLIRKRVLTFEEWRTCEAEQKQDSAKPELPGLCHEKICLWEYADSKDPDQSAQPGSLIRAFAVRKQNHCIL